MSSDKPRTGVNRSLGTCRKDRLRILDLDVAKKLDELVFVIPIELQNYARTIPFWCEFIDSRQGDYDVSWASGSSSSWTKPIREIFTYQLWELDRDCTKRWAKRETVLERQRKWKRRKRYAQTTANQYQPESSQAITWSLARRSGDLPHLRAEIFEGTLHRLPLVWITYPTLLLTLTLEIDHWPLT